MRDVDATGAQKASSVVRRPDEGKRIPLGDAGVVTLKVVGGESGGTLSMYEFVMPPRTAGPPLHLHRGMDEAFYVLDGEMTFVVNEEITTAPAGSLVFVPRGVLHTFWNAGEVPARQLTVFAPAGIEHYFAAVTEALAAGGEDARDAAAALMGQHDMVVPPDSRPAYGTLSRTTPKAD